MIRTCFSLSTPVKTFPSKNKQPSYSFCQLIFYWQQCATLHKKGERQRSKNVVRSPLFLSVCRWLGCANNKIPFPIDVDKDKSSSHRHLTKRTLRFYVPFLSVSLSLSLALCCRQGMLKLLENGLLPSTSTHNTTLFLPLGKPY